ncbi:MAG: DUF1579 domain-containing protein [Cohaesibacteraceae bacterium]|nr:DUF1579 domain-containing protein [Cohaesibacteraceae bacterium]
MTGNDGTEFDFLMGDWHVQHRRLRERLTGSNDWQDFPGHMSAHHVLGGLGNMDDNYLEFPGDPYRAISLRSFDPASGKWAIWWLDGRSPHSLDVPVVGGFENDTGLFFANDIIDGKPVRVRFMWTRMDSENPRWEQSLTSDDGASWETNWIMDFRRSE